MTFADQRIADQAVFFNTDEFAVSGTYRVKSTGAEIPGSFLFHPGDDLGMASPGQGRIAEIRGRASVVSRPEIYDEIVIPAGVWAGTWRVDLATGRNANSWTIRASMDPRVQT